MTAAGLWPPRPALAGVPVVAAALAQAVALSLGSAGYGYHRDELYVRMLPAAWGSVHQPPCVPCRARSMAAAVDQPWALRLPATLATALSVVLVALGLWRIAEAVMGAKPKERFGQGDNPAGKRGKSLALAVVNFAIPLSRARFAIGNG